VTAEVSELHKHEMASPHLIAPVITMWSAPRIVPFEELQRTFAARYPASDPLDLWVEGSTGRSP